MSVAAEPITRLDPDQRHAELVRIFGELVALLDPDPTRPGLQDTPERCARLWGEFLDHDPGRYDTRFPLEAETSDDLVVVSGMSVWSYCEHHLLPFVADITIGYLPDGHILGLSKFGRIARMASHRLQVQERLVSEIADQVLKVTESDDVAVVARGIHLCMWMRGVGMQGVMTSSATRGRFREDVALRQEFLALVGQHSPMATRGLLG
jgi:GTP cyclohydrolase I